MHDPMGFPHQARPTTRIERQFERLARAVAILGGLVFIGLIVLSLATIISRKLGFLLINGDIELMQAGTALALSCFLPYCTLLGEHLKVEFFTENLGEGWRLILDIIGDGVLVLLFAVLAWRSGLQAWEMRDSGEVTPLLSIPVWLLVASIAPFLAFSALCAAQRALVELIHCLAPGLFHLQHEETRS